MPRGVTQRIDPRCAIDRGPVRPRTDFDWNRIRRRVQLGALTVGRCEAADSREADSSPSIRTKTESAIWLSNAKCTVMGNEGGVRSRLQAAMNAARSKTRVFISHTDRQKHDDHGRGAPVLAREGDRRRAPLQCRYERRRGQLHRSAHHDFDGLWHDPHGCNGLGRRHPADRSPPPTIVAPSTPGIAFLVQTDPESVGERSHPSRAPKGERR